MAGLSTEITAVPLINFTENDARWCYVRKEPEACVRISLLIVLAVVTGILCTLRIIQYHWYKAKNYHQYIVYYVAVLICILSIIHWAYVRNALFDFLNTYFTVIQLLVISLYFYSWASRILQQEKIFALVVILFLIGALIYFTGAVIWATVSVVDTRHECTQPQWLLFSSSELIMVQLFLVAVIYISRKLNDVRTTRTNRLSQKAQLWGLTVIYEIVSVFTFTYDLYLLITKEDDDDCGTVFTRNNVGMTAIYIIHKVVKYLLPQWAICVIFSPLKRRVQTTEGDRDETTTLSWAEKPNYQSIFYQTSNEEDRENDIMLPLPINSLPTPQSAYPILPRNTPLTPHSYYSSPWLKTVPGQSFPGAQPTLHS